ncbi:MAG TPA: phosphatidylinositol mannoside acyltransferase [Chloroflexota bacterium]|jgi:lauroyl/myristoyl acyltransferase|nr:phosphatidylinositol mannoside acyltransferase [Chloroflexota bacterium]
MRAVALPSVGQAASPPLVGGAIYWLHLAGRWLARVLPLRLSYALAARGGALVYYLWASKRRHAVANFRQILGPQRAHLAPRLARASFANYGRYLVDMLRLSGRECRALDGRLVVDGLEHIAAAFARGRGLIMVGAHLGNSDLGGALFAARGYPVHVIAERLHPPRWNALVQATRRDCGLQVLETTAPPREILRVLRRNEVLCLLVDRPLHHDGSGVPVRFFGAPTRVPAGAATLALRTGAALLAACMVRVGDGFRLEVRPVREVARSGDRAADIQQLTQHVMDALAEFIRRYPEQWFMFRPMWPAGHRAASCRSDSDPLAASQALTPA